MTCTATYTVTTLDTNLGQIVNSATVSGTSAYGAATSTSSATVLAEQHSSMLFTKSATPTSGDIAVGNTISYSFVVTNTGNVNLANLIISDTMSGMSALACTPSAPATLLPNQTMNCSYLHRHPK